MAELKYDENGVPVRKFPVTMVKPGSDEAVYASSEVDVVNAEWRGYVVQGEGERALAAAEKATAAHEKAQAKS